MAKYNCWAQTLIEKEFEADSQDDAEEMMLNYLRERDLIQGIDDFDWSIGAMKTIET